jgi:hypothetical protein
MNERVSLNFNKINNSAKELSHIPIITLHIRTAPIRDPYLFATKGGVESSFHLRDKIAQGFCHTRRV